MQDIINLFVLIHSSPRLRRVEKDPQYLEKLQDITQNGNLMSAKDIDRTQSIVFDTTLSDTF